MQNRRCRYCAHPGQPPCRRHRRNATRYLFPVYPKLLMKPRKPGIQRFYAAFQMHNMFAENVARLVSLTPALSREEAADLLRRNGGSVRRAAREARRVLAVNDPSVCAPVPDDFDFRYMNIGHALNSCYIASTVAACFASWDAWDALLTPPPGAATVSKVETLRTCLRKIVNQVRQGKAVSKTDVEAFRTVMVALGFPDGKRQEDATDFFATLVDHLGAPLLPLGENLHHRAAREDVDERVVVERFIWLSLDQTSDSYTFELLLYNYFLGEQRTGIRRRLRGKQEIVDAWCVRLLLPEYAPSQSGSSLRRNSFDTLAMPFSLKRYTGTMQKNRARVELPTTLDVTNYVDPHGGRYSLRLKSVVCHIGARLGSGHYVAYTYDAAGGWRRWDDLSRGAVSRDDEAEDGLPRNERWRDELLRDSYMVFYELLPGDGSTHPGAMLDASTSGELDVGSLPGEMSELLEVVMNTEHDEDFARHMQEQLYVDYIQAEEDGRVARGLQAEEDSEYADALSEDNTSNTDEDVARRLQLRDDAEYARRENRRALSRKFDESKPS